MSGSTQTSAAMEMYQLADELSYITGVAGVCFAITLVVSQPHGTMYLQMIGLPHLPVIASDGSAMVCRSWQQLHRKDMQCKIFTCSCRDWLLALSFYVWKPSQRKGSYRAAAVCCLGGQSA